MTSRERILTALNHREPDRVPIDLGSYRSSGIAAIAYPKLRAALGLEPKPIYVYDPVQQLAIVHEDVLDRVGADAIELGRGFCHEEEWWADWTLPDGTACKMPVWALPERSGDEWIYRAPAGHVMARMPVGSVHFDQTWWPFVDGPEDLGRIEELYAQHMWTGLASPPGPSISNNEELAEGARRLRASTNRAIVGLFGGILRPQRHDPAISGPFPKPSRFSSHVPEAVLELIYLPILKHADRWLLPLRKLQHGQIPLYILYIFITVMVLLILAP